MRRLEKANRLKLESISEESEKQSEQSEGRPVSYSQPLTLKAAENIAMKPK